ncbi:hypothetical protein K440DRAFT_642511 [Wilcoxina mikolae CBS 423.85]|nr:hypothetical protein K440DRAFT_642511 [Wilcoxina mikolae CBS 423.85]
MFGFVDQIEVSDGVAFGSHKDPDFDRSLPTLQSPTEDSGNRTSKRLFNPDRDDAKTFNPQVAPPVAPNSRLYDESTPHRRKNKDKDLPQPYVAVLAPHESEERLRMAIHPETRPINPEQLICEVKGIYAGLIMVEAKYYEVDTIQHQAALEIDGRQPTMDNEQWYEMLRP